jgi:hypothetical protein
MDDTSQSHAYAVLGKNKTFILVAPLTAFSIAQASLGLSRIWSFCQNSDTALLTKSQPLETGPKRLQKNL